MQAKPITQLIRFSEVNNFNIKSKTYFEIA